MWEWASESVPLNIFRSILKKLVSVWERNIKLLVEIVNYIAIIKTVICTIWIETVMCIIHCRKYHLHNCNPDSTCIITIKIFAHIFAAETFTCTSTTETSNCMNGTETVTCIIATERSTNISMTESTTCITGIEPQELHNCNRCCHQHEYYRKCQLHSCNRNCHLQNWPQKLLLAEMVPVRDSFSYNKEVEWMAKD